MFYISSFDGTLFGVTDINDGVEEFYTKRQLVNISKSGIDIIGLHYSSYTEKWEFNVYDKGYVFKYSLIDYQSGKYTLDKYIYFKGSRVDCIESKNLGRVSCSGNELNNILNSGIAVKGLDMLNNSRISLGDRVIYGKKDGKEFLVKASLLEPYLSKGLYEFNKALKNLSSYSFMCFSSSSELLSFVSSNKLVIVNDLLVEGSDKYWALNEEYGIDRVLVQCGRYIPLAYCVSTDLVSTLEMLLVGNYEISEVGNGYYNPRGKRFHFTASKTLSFELDTTQPETPILVESYDWQADIKRWGVCIVKASIHSKKRYDSDVWFYSG